jgi:excisionase family DNA binding protein
MSQGSDLLTVAAVARLLKRHPDTVRRWVRSGAIPTARLADGTGRTLVRRSDVEYLMRSGEDAAQALSEAPLSDEQIAFVRQTMDRALEALASAQAQGA